MWTIIIKKVRIDKATFKLLITLEELQIFFFNDFLKQQNYSINYKFNIINLKIHESAIVIGLVLSPMLEEVVIDDFKN